MFDMEGPMIELAADFHVHPDYSIDAKGSLDEYCEMALTKRLLELCFTTHYDADPKYAADDAFMVINGNKEKLSDETLTHYFENIRRVHEEYGMLGLMIRGGLEFGWYEGCEAEVTRIKNKFPVEFSIGGVHSVDGLCLCEESSKKLFKNMPLEKLADKYFAKLEKCAASGVFDCLAHIDVYRKYGLEFYGDDILTIHRGRIEKLFDTMIVHNVGYEVNTSAIRHGHPEYYPTMEIVNLAREKGVLLRSLGSDAHCPEQLGLDFEVASSIIYDLFPYVDE
ncbi:MAG: histidinol-phosphatase HisJ family protein [candidate division Zixibacteria bacterium]|nr:histidinol-phosphatase HisJ family protein [candidate division Zixibacteria bacterium]